MIVYVLLGAAILLSPVEPQGRLIGLVLMSALTLAVRRHMPGRAPANVPAPRRAHDEVAALVSSGLGQAEIAARTRLSREAVRLLSDRAGAVTAPAPAPAIAAASGRNFRSVPVHRARRMMRRAGLMVLRHTPFRRSRPQAQPLPCEQHPQLMRSMR